MPSIKPFKGIIYNKNKVKELARVVAPPYDIIPPKMQDELYRKDGNNIVRLILGKIEGKDNETENRYTRAAKLFRSWLESGVLIQDSAPAIYVYSQVYKYDGKAIERTGFISLMELDLEDKKVLPHEKTLQAPKEDRLKLMRRMKANLSPIFMLYEDGQHKVRGILKAAALKAKPFIDVKFDGVRHLVWKLTDKDAIGRIENEMSKKDIFIADGHHRYETSKNYAREIASSDEPLSVKENSKFFMAYFVELEEKSLTILPTHRLIKDTGGLGDEELIKRLGSYFKIERYPSAARLMSRLKSLKGSHAFGMYMGGARYYVLKLKSFDKASLLMGVGSEDWKSLDVSILHLVVLQNLLGISDEDDNIEFVKDASEAFKAVKQGGYPLAFILNPTKVTQVRNVARIGEKMPRKATYFYPKPLSGLVINKF